jgi:Zn-dependent peptidase ImmA (M78 family)
MYFSFCHDLYHILHGTPEYINEKREVHFNKDYYSTNDNENKANLFAANLLMPEKEFISLYNLYKNDYATSIEAIIVKLMYYFNAPFIAVLIRLYELNILNKLEDVKNILEYKNNEIEDVFDSLFLDKDILKPTLKDQMEYVFSILEKEGHDLIEKQLLTEYNYKRIIDNIKKLYDKIRLKD